MIIIILGLFFLFRKTVSKEIVQPVPQNQTQTIKAIFEVENIKYETEITADETVYDMMDNLKQAGKINFKEKIYLGMGKFIEEINGIKANEGKYWIYYVNGKKAQVGVSNYKLKSGDVVSWKYEKM